MDNTFKIGDIVRIYRVIPLENMDEDEIFQYEAMLGKHGRVISIADEGEAPYILANIIGSWSPLELELVEPIELREPQKVIGSLYG